jgi:hypothetical protein
VRRGFLRGLLAAALVLAASLHRRDLAALAISHEEIQPLMYKI